MGHSWSLFLYFRLFYKQLTANKCSIKVADDWIRTWVLWYWKQPLCQLRHNHCPVVTIVKIVFWTDENKWKRSQELSIKKLFSNCKLQQNKYQYNLIIRYLANRMDSIFIISTYDSIAVNKRHLSNFSLIGRLCSDQKLKDNFN